MQITEIRNAILTGAFDAHLDTLSSTIRSREATRATMHAQALKPGDIVTVNGLRPNYINGQEATIIRVNRTRVVVKFNEAARAGRFGDGEVTVPLTNITPTGASTTPPAPTNRTTNQRMRVGEPVTIPEMDWREQDAWFEKYRQDKDIINFPVADGYASYEVRGNTLHHIPIGDAWHAHPALLRGITKTEVDAMLENNRRLNALPTIPPIS